MGFEELPSRPLMRPATVPQRKPTTPTHEAASAWPGYVRSNPRNGNGGGIDGPVSGKLAVKVDSGHHDQPRDNDSGEEYAGDAGADDVADAQIFRSDGGSKTRSGEPSGPAFRLRCPRFNGVHEEGVNAAETESPENAACEGAAAFARDEHFSASGAFGKYQVTVLLNDELAPQRHHEEHAEPPAEESQRKDSPKCEFGAEAEKNQRGNREHDAGGERFAG